MLVRSREKNEIGRHLFSKRFENRIDFFVYDSNALGEDTVEALKRKYGKDFAFQDVVIAAGDPSTIGLAHKMVSRTGWRIHTLAGTRGEVTVESGTWHYGNASTSGSSGCNTKAMENALSMIQRSTIQLSRFSGRRYTFNDLLEEPDAFFEDKYLRPVLLPNKDVPPTKWQET
jgi:hypothetical protein